MNNCSEKKCLIRGTFTGLFNNLEYSKKLSHKDMDKEVFESAPK